MVKNGFPLFSVYITIQTFKWFLFDVTGDMSFDVSQTVGDINTFEAYILLLTSNSGVAFAQFRMSNQRYQVIFNLL